MHIDWFNPLAPPAHYALVASVAASWSTHAFDSNMEGNKINRHVYVHGYRHTPAGYRHLAQRRARPHGCLRELGLASHPCEIVKLKLDGASFGERGGITKVIALAVDRVDQLGLRMARF